MDDYRFWNVVTYAFSYKGLGHICSNMFGFYLISRAIMPIIGPTAFLGVYLGGSAVAATGWIWFRPELKPPSAEYATGALGASAGIFALIGCCGVLQPSAKLIATILPIPAWSMLILLTAYELSSAVKQRPHELAGPQAGTDPTKQRKVGHSAHLVGMVFGGIVAIYLRNPSPHQVLKYKGWL